MLKLLKRKDAPANLPEFSHQVAQEWPRPAPSLIADYDEIAGMQMTTNSAILKVMEGMNGACPGFVSQDNEIVCIDRNDLNQHEAVALNHLVSQVRIIQEREPVIRQTTRSVFESYTSDNRETSLQEQARESSQQVNELLARAIEKNATDIHLEIKNNKSAVFLRIYGTLCLDQSFSKTQGLKIVSAVWNAYVNQAFSIGDTVKDGRFTHCRKGRRWLCRVSYGYSRVNDTRSLVVRLRDMNHVPGLATLGYHDSQLAAFKTAAAGKGIILIVGAVNSGKSTSQTALMAARPQLDKNLEISDQVEVELGNFVQLQLPIEGADDVIEENKERLRRLPTRHDVDFIAINEIRDRETAAMASSMMLQGTAGIASVHGSGWPDAINRLASPTDLGISPDILFSESFLSLIVVQSLAPVLCDRCKLDDHPDPFWRDYYRAGFGAAAYEKIRFHKPDGCPHCHRSGIQGLTLVAETIPIVESNRPLLKDATRPQAMRAWMRTAGVLNVHQHAYQKICAGMLDPLTVQRKIGGFNRENLQELWHGD